MPDPESQTPATTHGLKALTHYHGSPWLKQLPEPERKGSQNPKQPPDTRVSAEKLPVKVRWNGDTERDVPRSPGACRPRAAPRGPPRPGCSPGDSSPGFARPGLQAWGCSRGACLPGASSSEAPPPGPPYPGLHAPGLLAQGSSPRDSSPRAACPGPPRTGLLPGASRPGAARVGPSGPGLLAMAHYR